MDQRHTAAATAVWILVGGALAVGSRDRQSEQAQAVAPTAGSVEAQKAAPAETLIEALRPGNNENLSAPDASAIVGGPASAQAAPEPASKFRITDNSFLVEEAFNQDAGVFQNSFVMARSRATGAWSGSFTQEWPVSTIRHQLSVTVPMSVMDGNGAVGDGLINYRFQAWSGKGKLPLFSPRLSAVLPTSAQRREYGTSGVGWQMNLPFSKEVGFVFFHWNAGTTWLREAGTGTLWQTTPSAAGSVIVAVRPMFNLMFETYSESRPGAAGREVSTTFAPGFRTGWNVGDQQWVVGVAVQVTRGAVSDTGILTYLSYELPFMKTPGSK